LLRFFCRPCHFDFLPLLHSGKNHRLSSNMLRTVVSACVVGLLLQVVLRSVDAYPEVRSLRVSEALNPFRSSFYGQSFYSFF
jgi:hypothetical protein